MLKLGVDLRGIHPVWGIAYPIIQRVFDQFGYECIVTSANDSKHGPNSLHYKGKALDLRTKHLQVMDKGKLMQAIKSALGPQFDVVFEAEGTANEHCHLEFDPKEPEKSEPV
jgi:hypothetical protein